MGRGTRQRDAGSGGTAEAALQVEIPHLRHTLANGLNLLVHRDPSLPLAAVNLWYHVGSKDERPGRSGFAHLFEHLMFEGSAHVPRGAFDTLLESAGGVSNGSTSNDRTNYWATVPSTALELPLWLEADRMGFFLETLGQEKLDLQRDVVMNERRQTVEDQPYGLAWETAYRALYPSDHPYHRPVIGSMRDLAAATLEDARAFFRTFYAPGNATLAVAGDVDPDEVAASVERWFGPIPAGPPVPGLELSPATLPGDRKLMLEDGVHLPRLYMAWHTPKRFAPDDAALEILASVLSDGTGSRLHRRLVYEEEVAQDVSAFQNGQEVAGSFWIVATARPDVSLGRLEEMVEEELRRLVAGGITEDERLRAVSGTETDFVRSLERVGGFGGKADRLNEYHVLAGDAGFAGRDLARFRAVEVGDVARVAASWLLDRRSVRLAVVPRGRRELAPPGSGFEVAPEVGEVGATPVTTAPAEPPPAASLDPTRARAPVPGDPPRLVLPAVDDWRRPGGLRVLVARRSALPVVTLQLQLPGGASAHPAGRAGLAALTADMLDEGTATRTAVQIGEEVELLGARLGSTADYDASVLRLTLLRDRLERGLELLADVLVRPTFPLKELERVRARRSARILQRTDDPSALADDAFTLAAYGAHHPYGPSLLGSVATLSALGRDEVEAFHAERYRPDGATLVVAGDVSREELDPLLDRVLQGWEGRVSGPEAPPRPTPSAGVWLVDRPGAAQSELRVGRPSLSRSDPRHPVAAVANTVLGGAFTSRLNRLLREEKGYTYGAWSWFDLRAGPGPFVAQAAVEAAATAESVGHLVAEMDRMGREPVPVDELERARSYLALRLPQRFESTVDVVARLGELALYDLPLDFWEHYVDDVLAVGSDAVLELAREEMRSDAMCVVVAGDRRLVEDSLRALELGPVRLVTPEEAAASGPAATAGGGAR